MKKIIAPLLIVAALTVLTLPMLASAAGAIGCCIKTNVKDSKVKPTTIGNVTKDQCDAVEKETDGVLKGTFKVDHVADSNGCKKIPPKIPQRSLDSPVYFAPAVTIPDSEFTSNSVIAVEESTTTLVEYFVAISKYAIGIIGIIAVIALMTGGVLWLTAAGNQEQIGSAKTIIGSSIAGLVLSFSSFLILSMVNTNLVNIKIAPVSKVQRISAETGCCLKTDKQDPTKITSQNLEKDVCARITYATTEFKSYSKDLGWVAQNNTCVPTTGCCFLDIGKQVIIELPWGDDQMCIENIPAHICNGEQTSGWWNVVPGVNLVKDDVDAIHSLGQKCAAVPDCNGKITCTTVEDCKAKLNR